MDIKKKHAMAHPLHFFKQTPPLLSGIIFAILFLVCCSQVKFSQYFPIKQVNVYGINHLNTHQVQDLVTPFVKHGFFNVKIATIREHLLQMPWVADTIVRRQWPNKVEITLYEKQALAVWNQEGLLSQNGEIFTPPLASYPLDIPHFIGPNGKQLIMMQYFAEINRILEPLHAKIATLELSTYFTWKLSLTNGITIRLGHKDILLRLAHFVKVYPKIIGERANDVEYIDLRYANGMAVQWKTAT